MSRARFRCDPDFFPLSFGARLPAPSDAVFRLILRAIIFRADFTPEAGFSEEGVGDTRPLREESLRETELREESLRETELRDGPTDITEMSGLGTSARGFRRDDEDRLREDTLAMPSDRKDPTDGEADTRFSWLSLRIAERLSSIDLYLALDKPVILEGSRL